MTTTKPSVADLKERVASSERELHASIDQIEMVISDALDWRRKVRDNPVQAAAVAAAIGFVVLRQPGVVTGLLKQAGGVGLKSLAGAGGGSLVSSLLARFMRNR